MSQLGCHGQWNTPETLQYAKVSYVAKCTDDLAIIEAAPDDALRIARRIFSGPEQDRFIDQQDDTGLVNAILDFLHGYRHRLLYVEVLNEIGKGRNAAYVQLCKKVVPRLQAAGVKVLVPSWGTGDFEWEQWLAWRNENWCGADGISTHAYWGLPKGTSFDKLFTAWNALRYRTYWNVGGNDPKLLVVTECGRDRVNDGPNNSSVGNGGHLADGVSAEEFAKELLAYAERLLADKVIGTPFTNGPKPDMSNFNMDPVVQYLIAHAGPCILPDLSGGTPVPAPGQVYPKALWTPLTNNFTVGGAMPKIIVVHGTSGLGDPFGHWNNPATRASADFWIPRAGPKVKQYVRLGDTSWSNGPLKKPDLSVPFLKWLVEYQKTHPEITGNHYCVSLEFEKAPGNKSALTAWQITEGRELIKWLSDGNGIPLDRNHVLGHYQFDSVNRPFCPGPIPWEELISNYGELAERNYWGPMWSAINWARMKGRVTQAQQIAIHEMINKDKIAAGVS